MNWNEFAKEVHQVAVDHGWWEKKPDFAEIAVMCHSELSEAAEEWRNSKPAVYCDDEACMMEESCNKIECLSHFPRGKPGGYAVELADCILRILDYLVAEGDNIRIGPYELGDGNIIMTIAMCHSKISDAFFVSSISIGSKKVQCEQMQNCIEIIMAWAALNNVDMKAILRAKHEYNKTRPYRHGGKKL